MSAAELAPITILVVDDTDANRFALARTLEQAGFTVRLGSSAADALRLALANPDLIVLDLQLPTDPDQDVCRKLKADPRTTAVPILQISASRAEDDHRAPGLESGADGYLTYPLEPRELLATVRALLRIRQSEQARRVQNEWLRVTLSSIADGVIATDIRGRVNFLNPVAEELTGWSQLEAAGKPLQDIFHVINDQTGEAAENTVIRAMRDGEGAGRVTAKTLLARDGTPRPISDSAAPIRDDRGDFLGFVLVFRDVTERRRLENALRQRAEELATLDRRKNEFLAMLAHELRNPLAPIRNAVHILRQSGNQGPAPEEARAIVERQVGILARLVDDLLDVSRVSRGKIQLRKEPIELAAVVARAVETSRPLIGQRRHDLRVSLPVGPLRLEADPTRLEQILTNLLNNAAKYTDPGGTIWLTAERSGAEAVMRVRDTGIGMAPHVLPQVFDLFTQSDRALDRALGGLGIGLTLVRTLVGMHGGSVTAASPGQGQGSEFTVRLPALPADFAPPAAPAVDGAARPAARRLRILVVDDNIDTAITLAMLLELEGHEVRMAHTGQEAVALTDSYQPELVLLDIGLPGMDGYQVAARLRQGEGERRRVLVALTGYGQEEDRRRSVEAGFDYHYVKPVDPEVLHRLLGRLGGERARGRDG